MTNSKIIRVAGKADTLTRLNGTKRFLIPESFVFTVSDWDADKENVVRRIINQFADGCIAVRSSSIFEDSVLESMAGAYLSSLDVRPRYHDVVKAIEDTIGSYGDKASPNNQILIQKMVTDVSLSGVIFTRTLEDGAPYYVLSYDDQTGRTDSITGGGAVHKTVFLYRSAVASSIKSPRIRDTLLLAKSVEEVCGDGPFDIEFVVDRNQRVYLLQVRHLVGSVLWEKRREEEFRRLLDSVKKAFKRSFKEGRSLRRVRTVFSNMSDWNPAEMIGPMPKPLATSLYKELITKSIWCRARSLMGYDASTGADLMTLFAERPYIDVRKSLSSLLPVGLSETTKERLVDKSISLLEENRGLDDRIEFDIAITVYTPNFADDFKRIYGSQPAEVYSELEGSLKILTKRLVSLEPSSSLVWAENRINQLEHDQIGRALELEKRCTVEELLSAIYWMIQECKEFGTLPFAVLARHGFIAKSLVQSLVEQSVLTRDRVEELYRSIKTVATEFSLATKSATADLEGFKKFIEKYGHLRPGTYDIESARYVDRFTYPVDFENKGVATAHHDFSFSKKESVDIEKTLLAIGLKNLSCNQFYQYLQRAIYGRERAKLIFSRNVSDILEHIGRWGLEHGLERRILAFSSIDMFKELYEKKEGLTTENLQNQLIERSFKWRCHKSIRMGHFLSRDEDIVIVPMNRSQATYITQMRVQGETILIDSDHSVGDDLEKKVVCVVSADPGYDWLFLKDIVGLITCFGGPNSHMAIRCVENELPAAIGVGEEVFSRIVTGMKLKLDCDAGYVELV